MSPEGAAQHLCDDPGGVSLVFSKYSERFLTMAKELGVQPVVFAELTGYNYTKGKWMKLLFYRCADGSKHTSAAMDMASE